MSFTNGFAKTAAEPVAFGALGSALKKGLSSAGGETIGDTLKLKGLKHISDAVKANKGLGKSFSTQKGREGLVAGIGKAAPSLATTAAYGVGAKKAYNKITDNSNQSQQGYY